MTWSSGACRTSEDRRRQRWRKVREQVHQQPPRSPGLRGLLFKPSFHFPSTVVNLFSACNSGARALPQSLPASGAQEPPPGSLTTDKGQATPRAHPWPPAGLGESEPGPQAASHPWEGGTRLQAGKAGHRLTLDSGLRGSCTGGDFQLLTQTTAAVGEVDGACGCLQLTPRRPRTTAQACPHSELTSQVSWGKPRCTCQLKHLSLFLDAPPPRPAQRHRPCEGGSLRRAGPRGCSRGSVQPPAPPHVLSSQDTPTLPRDLGSHGGGLGGAWVSPQPQEARGRDWPSASLCQGRAPGTPQLPPLPPRASSWEPSTA